MSRDLTLTPQLRALVGTHAGEITKVSRTAARGRSSDLTAVLDCARGRFFVKAMRNRRGGRRDSLVRERLINPFVRPLSPRLLWEAEDDHWLVAGFEAVDGRPADFGPGSSDLPGVVEALNEIARIRLPAVADGWAEERWDRFASGTEHVLRGNTLLHTDIAPHNVLIGDGTTWVVDWSWPTRGAGFIDPATFVVQLIASGHAVEAAQEWASGCDEWSGADPSAVDAFALAHLRMWRTRAERFPGQEWVREMAGVTRRWAGHRGLEG